MATALQSELQDQDQQPSTPQSSSEVTIVPFVRVGDGWILSDAFLAGVYERTVREGLAPRVFWHGTISTPQQFIDMVKRELSVFVFEGSECVGFAWINGFSGSHAFAHFCLFVQGPRADEAGYKLLEYWFSFPGEDGPLLDTILGIVPGFNRLAHNYVQRLGFQVAGRIPGMLKNKRGDREDAVIFFKSR